MIYHGKEDLIFFPCPAKRNTDLSLLFFPTGILRFPLLSREEKEEGESIFFLFHLNSYFYPAAEKFTRIHFASSYNIIAKETVFNVFFVLLPFLVCIRSVFLPPFVRENRSHRPISRKKEGTLFRTALFCIKAPRYPVGNFFCLLKCFPKAAASRYDGEINTRRKKNGQMS